MSGASPLVDVQSLTRQTVFTREVLDALPASHNIQSAAVMIPGVTVSGLVGQTGRDVGGTSKLQQPSLVFRGTELSITRWDGFHLSNLTVSGAGGGTSFYVNDAAAQEVAYSSGADSADMSHPGLYVDLVPKDGGNRFSGYVFGDFTYDGWSASNLSRDLQDRGITNVSIVHRNYDFNPGVGGPIRRDSLWFYGAFRYEGHDATVVDSYYDKNPAPYLYEPDLDRPAHDSGTIPNESFRLTWQATPKDKAQFWLTNQNKSRELYGVNAEHHAGRRRPPAHPLCDAGHAAVDADADQSAAPRGRVRGRGRRTSTTATRRASPLPTTARPFRTRRSIASPIRRTTRASARRPATARSSGTRRSAGPAAPT